MPYLDGEQCPKRAYVLGAYPLGYLARTGFGVIVVRRNSITLTANTSTELVLDAQYLPEILAGSDVMLQLTMNNQMVPLITEADNDVLSADAELVLLITQTSIRKLAQ